MIALVRLRLAGFLRTGRALAPVLAGLLALGVLYGGGRAQPAEAYGVSAVVLFPVLAWQTKILLDVEPDVQRRLARVVLGPARERAAGLLAAAVAGLGTVAVALVFPWLVGGVTGPAGPGDRPLAEGLALGLWAHLLACRRRSGWAPWPAGRSPAAPATASPCSPSAGWARWSWASPARWRPGWRRPCCPRPGRWPARSRLPPACC